MLVLSPGPGICDPNVLQVLAQPCIHHRSNAFKQTYREIIKEMRKLLHAPNSEIIIMNGSGSYGMEGAVKNLLHKNDRVLSIRCGYFGDRLFQMARHQSCDVYSLQYTDGDTYRPKDVRWMMEHVSFDAVLVTHCETEPGSLQNLQFLGELCRQHHALLIVDSISGVIMNEVEMEKWHIDCLIMASQKGFLMPPGLSMTAFSKTALQVMKKQRNNSYIFDYPTMLKKLHDDARIHTTPNINMFTALHTALRKLNAVPTQKLADHYKTLHAYTKKELLSMGFTILAQGHDSHSLIVCKTPAAYRASRIQKDLEKHGIRIELGLCDREDRILRIGIMNAVTKHDLQYFLNTLRGILHET